MKVLITGATGFIGSNITKELLDKGYIVYATCRNSSSFEKCLLFKDKINWINTDFSDWKEQIKTIKPDQLLHVAWGGIEAGDRNNWDIQIRNFWLSKELFDLALECEIKKIIAFGSQAEYGAYSFPVSETTAPMPNDAYGAIKTLTANYLRNLAEMTSTQWYWIRIFSVFGEGENSSWLLPSVISKLLNNEAIQLTACEQQYNYLYIKDFCLQLLEIIENNDDKTGIYNLCADTSIAIKDLLIQVANLIGNSNSLLQFGTIAYRNGQNMFIAGDNTKYRESFAINDENLAGLKNGLIQTIEYHKQKQA